MSLRPTFSGFETMRKSINASQKALDITGHNIANAGTLGYSRQRLDLVSLANRSGGLGYDTSVSLAGQGVNATGVTQLRDTFLDKRFRELNADSSHSAMEVNILTNIEDVLGTINTDGFNMAYQTFKSNLSKFATNSTNTTEIANVVLSSAKQAVQTLRGYSNDLDEIQAQTEFEISAGVNRVSEILKQVADLNKQITNEYVASGDIFIDGDSYTVNSVYGPNELKDSRNTLLDELSNYGNIKVSDNDNGSINVKFAGNTVVEDQKYSKLVLDKNTQGTLSLHLENDVGVITQVTTEAGSLDTGSLKGYLDMYNGAGVYANDMSIRQDGMKDAASDINDLLSDMSKLSTTGRQALEEKLKEYDSGFAVNSTTGEVTFSGTVPSTTVLTAAAADPATNPSTVTEFAVSIDSANSISYTVGGAAATMTDGSAKKAIDDTAKSTFTEDRGIVYYRKAIDALANTFAQAYNAATSSGTMKREMFSSTDGGVITASNIKVSDRWSNNALMITQSMEWTDSTQTATKDVISGSLSTDYVSRLIGVASAKCAFTIDASNITNKCTDTTDTIDGYISFLTVSRLGGDLEYQNSVYTAADAMATNVSNSRDNVMGVSINDEGADMMNFQKWFNASSRMMTTLDEALDTIINSMGLVGR